MRTTAYFCFMVVLVGLLMMSKLGCIAVNLGGSSSSPQAKFKETRTLTAPAAPALAVKTRNGAVTLRRGPADLSQTQITAHLAATTEQRLHDTRILAEPQPDGTLALSVAWPDNQPQNNESCSFDVTLPAATTRSLAAETSNGAIDLKELAGPAHLRTSNGAIRVTDHAGPVDARTSNGAVTLTRVQGNTEAHTSNGSVDMNDVPGPAVAHTSNGRVSVSLSPTATTAPVDIQTSNGSANLTLPKTYAGHFSLSTSNGSLSYPKGPAVHDLSATKHNASFSLGADTPTQSRVSTSNGSIDVRLAD